MKSIKVRETLDIKEWTRIHDQIFNIEKHYPEECEFYWMATVDGEPAGICSMALLKQNEGWGYFTRAGVLKKFRGLGIHKKMITVRKRLAKKLKLEGIITYAHKDNTASINHLMQKGFIAYIPENQWLDDWKGEFLYFQLTF